MIPTEKNTESASIGDRPALKYLIIGAAGFVGRHLLEYLAKEDALTVFATKLPFETINTANFPNVVVCDLDITIEADVFDLLAELKPDAIIHLAALSSVALSFQKPEITMQINLMGSLHVIEAIRRNCPSCTAVFIGSSEQYGPVPAEFQPVKETMHTQPVSPYAISKTAVESLASLYVKCYGLRLIMVRAFNHIGPGQLPLFVASDFASQIVRIERGESPPRIEVGNLSVRRDFTDVRDIVRGYYLLSRMGRPGEVYNIGSGKSILVSSLLDELLSRSSVKIDVHIDEKKYRPVDVPEFVADITKIKADTSWEPLIPLSESLSDTLAYWRRNV